MGRFFKSKGENTDYKVVAQEGIDLLNSRKGSKNGAGKLVRRERQKSGDWGRESQSPINVFVGGNDRGRIKHVLSANTSSFITLIRLYQIVCFVTLTLKQIMGDRRTGKFS